MNIFFLFYQILNLFLTTERRAAVLNCCCLGDGFDSKKSKSSIRRTFIRRLLQRRGRWRKIGFTFLMKILIRGRQALKNLLKTLSIPFSPTFLKFKIFLNAFCKFLRPLTLLDNFVILSAVKWSLNYSKLFKPNRIHASLPTSWELRYD